MAELERFVPAPPFLTVNDGVCTRSLNILRSFQLYAILRRSKRQLCYSLNTYLLISNTSCTAMLWASRSGIACFQRIQHFYAGYRLTGYRRRQTDSIYARKDSDGTLRQFQVINYFVHGGILYYFLNVKWRSASSIVKHMYKEAVTTADRRRSYLGTINS